MVETPQCQKSFSQQHQELLQDVEILKSVSGDVMSSDQYVRTSSSDSTTGFLANKVLAVSGIDFEEVTNGIHGNALRFALDLAFLDGRYRNQSETVITLGLNSAIHNGYVKYERILNGIPSLNYQNGKIPSSSWSLTIPKDYWPGTTSLIWRWTVQESVSGICLFQVEYNSMSPGEILSLPYTQIVSGISDGTSLKIYENQIDLVSGALEANDLFLLKFTRFGDLPQDGLETSVQILGMQLIYKEY